MPHTSWVGTPTNATDQCVGQEGRAKNKKVRRTLVGVMLALAVLGAGCGMNCSCSTSVEKTTTTTCIATVLRRLHAEPDDAVHSLADRTWITPGCV